MRGPSQYYGILFEKALARLVQAHQGQDHDGYEPTNDGREHGASIVESKGQRRGRALGLALTAFRAVVSTATFFLIPGTW